MSEGIRSITAGLQKSLSMIAKSQQDEFNQDQVNRRIVAKGIIANRNKTLGFNLERDLQLQISQQLLETDFEKPESVEKSREKIYGEQGFVAQAQANYESGFTRIPNAPNEDFPLGLERITRQGSVAADRFIELEQKGAQDALDRSSNNQLIDIHSTIRPSLQKEETPNGIIDALQRGSFQIGDVRRRYDQQIILEGPGEEVQQEFKHPISGKKLNVVTGRRLTDDFELSQSGMLFISAFQELVSGGRESLAFETFQAMQANPAFQEILDHPLQELSRQTNGVSSSIGKRESAREYIRDLLVTETTRSIKNFSTDNRVAMSELARFRREEELSGVVGLNVSQTDQIVFELTNKAIDLSTAAVGLGILTESEASSFVVQSTLPVQAREVSVTSSSGQKLSNSSSSIGDLLFAIQENNLKLGQESNPPQDLIRAIDIKSRENQGFSADEILEIFSLGARYEKENSAEGMKIHTVLRTLVDEGKLFRQNDLYSADERQFKRIERIKRSLSESVGMGQAYDIYTANLEEGDEQKELLGGMSLAFSSAFDDDEASLPIEDYGQLIVGLESVESGIFTSDQSSQSIFEPILAAQANETGSVLSRFTRGVFNPDLAGRPYTGSRSQILQNGVLHIASNDGITSGQALNKVLKFSNNIPNFGFVYGAGGLDPQLLGKTAYTALVMSGIAQPGLDEDDQKDIANNYEIIPINLSLDGDPYQRQFLIANKVTGERVVDSSGVPMIIDMQEFQERNIRTYDDYREYRSSDDPTPIFDDADTELAFHTNAYERPGFAGRVMDSVFSLSTFAEAASNPENKRFLESRYLSGREDLYPQEDKNIYTSDATNLQALLGLEDNNDALLALASSGPAGAELAKQGRLLSRSLQRWNYSGRPASVEQALVAGMRSFLLQTAEIGLADLGETEMNLSEYMSENTFQDVISQITDEQYDREETGMLGVDVNSFANDAGRWVNGLARGVVGTRNQFNAFLKSAGPNTDAYKDYIDIGTSGVFAFADYHPVLSTAKDFIGSSLADENAYTGRNVTDQEVQLAINEQIALSAQLHLQDVTIRRVDNLDSQGLIDAATSSEGLNPDQVVFKSVPVDTAQASVDSVSQGNSTDIRVNSESGKASVHSLSKGAPSVLSINGQPVTMFPYQPPDITSMTALDLPEADQKLPFMAIRGWIGRGANKNTKRYILEVPASNGKSVYVQKDIPANADPSETILSQFTTRFGKMPQYDIGELSLEEALKAGRIEFTPEVEVQFGGIADTEALRSANELAKLRRIGVHSETISIVESVNDDFIYNFHNRVLDENREGTDEKGKTVTMRLISVTPYENSEATYLIPSYNPETGEIMEMEEAIEYSLQFIKANEILPFPNVNAAKDFRKRSYNRVVKAPKREMDIRRYLSTSHDTRWRFLDDKRLDELLSISSEWTDEQLKSVLWGYDQIGGGSIPSAPALQKVYDHMYNHRTSLKTPLPQIRKGFVTGERQDLTLVPYGRRKIQDVD